MLLTVGVELAAGGPAFSQPAVPDISKLLADARSLQQQYKESEALAKYEQVLKQAPGHYEALWQASVLSVHIGSRYTDETRKAAYFAAARLYSTRALVVKSEGAESNYAEALALVNQATLLSSRGRLVAYKEMKPFVFKAVDKAPKWADAWQLLGRWHYRVDHYNLLERFYSQVFLGGMPGSASTPKAIEALSKAHELEPKKIQFCYDLARVYLNHGQRTRASSVLQEAAQLTPVTSEELEMSRRCRVMLIQLNKKMLKQLHHKVKKTL
ncbi:tetratricopeptide repeat protein [Hymenobacter sp. BT635]|uniref:Tetratricopeptide repeat protein n=1 Tax=Hymenobacter nitidus TaxID=2880929 RepID=A0ABS8AAL3_9BACT|nr:tetratricopeptide repeat protein [Hymenobacter nitidus]MCB2376941.1 tetratricopeptide repeat protein [Hymenobacter nitidus]